MREVETAAARFNRELSKSLRSLDKVLVTRRSGAIQRKIAMVEKMNLDFDTQSPAEKECGSLFNFSSHLPSVHTRSGRGIVAVGAPSGMIEVNYKVPIIRDHCVIERQSTNGTPIHKGASL
jgi:hypothetical protein